jgi:hypothetical protein
VGQESSSFTVPSAVISGTVADGHLDLRDDGWSVKKVNFQDSKQYSQVIPVPWWRKRKRRGKRGKQGGVSKSSASSLASPSSACLSRSLLNLNRGA